MDVSKLSNEDKASLVGFNNSGYATHKNFTAEEWLKLKAYFRTEKSFKEMLLKKTTNTEVL